MDSKSKGLFPFINEISKDDRKKTNTLFLLFILLLAGFASYFIFLKNDEKPIGNQERFCTFNQERYEVGDVFDVDCNTCVCTDSGISCTFKICDAKCVESDQQCAGQDDGNLCILGVWCDEDGKVCGGEMCKGLGLGICVEEKCIGD